MSNHFTKRMFDFVTRRRLIVLLFGLISITISGLFLSRFIPSYRRSSSTRLKISNSKYQISDCYESEPTDVLTLCEPCTTYERRSRAKACSSTGYRELVLCSTSNIQTFRACEVPLNIRRQQFWLFESAIFLISLLAIASVRSRQKILDRQMMEKIRKQIGESDQ